MKKSFNKILNVIICTLILILASLNFGSCQDSYNDFEGIVYKEDGQKLYEVGTYENGLIEQYGSDDYWNDVPDINNSVIKLVAFLEHNKFDHLYFNWYSYRFEVIQLKTGEIILLYDEGKISFGNMKTFRFYLIGYLTGVYFTDFE